MSEEAKERRGNSTAAFILSNEVFEKNSHFTAIFQIPTYLYVAGGKAGRKQKERCPRGKEDTIMNNKIVGAIFCLIAAILAGARYVAAAIFMSSTSTWSAELFQNSLNYVGPADCRHRRTGCRYWLPGLRSAEGWQKGRQVKNIAGSRFRHTA